MKRTEKTEKDTENHCGPRLNIADGQYTPRGDAPRPDSGSTSQPGPNSLLKFSIRCMAVGVTDRRSQGVTIKPRKPISDHGAPPSDSLGATVGSSID